MAVIVSKGIVVPSYGPPAGTTWLYETAGSFEVPANGKYEIEIHGGGGGPGWYAGYGTDYVCGGGGGGSGELYELTLKKGEVYAITVGQGGYQTGASFGYAEASSFGEYSCAGGGNGGNASYYYDPSWMTDATRTPGKGGTASGSLATAGGTGKRSVSSSSGGGSPGQGNKNNTAQTYGDGGSYTGENGSTHGKNGAVIITYLGVA